VNTAQKEINALAKNPHFEQFRPQVDQFAKSIGNQLIDWSKLSLLMLLRLFHISSVKQQVS
jgi:pantoate kinase